MDQYQLFFYLLLLAAIGSLCPSHAEESDNEGDMEIATQCTDLEISVCLDVLPYNTTTQGQNQTVLLNSFPQLEQPNSACAKDITFFLCGWYFRPCQSVADPPILPCRGFCERTLETCNGLNKEYFLQVTNGSGCGLLPSMQISPRSKLCQESSVPVSPEDSSSQLIQPTSSETLASSSQSTPTHSYSIDPLVFSVSAEATTPSISPVVSSSSAQATTPSISLLVLSSSAEPTTSSIFLESPWNPSLHSSAEADVIRTASTVAMVTDSLNYFLPSMSLSLSTLSSEYPSPVPSSVAEKSSSDFPIEPSSSIMLSPSSKVPEEVSSSSPGTLRLSTSRESSPISNIQLSSTFSSQSLSSASLSALPVVMGISSILPSPSSQIPVYYSSSSYMLPPPGPPPMFPPFSHYSSSHSSSDAASLFHMTTSSVESLHVTATSSATFHLNSDDYTPIKVLFPTPTISHSQKLCSL
uniref:Flocculation protein FLO11-like n=1 Tax=Saccoglossus kowalevskii TaxID=10224 RepID=A0ABM0MFK5_SACKO|nr:PREDICTED: flocculation protein FLO11-like [Saccoglossus kowalevskii]